MKWYKIFLSTYFGCMKAQFTNKMLSFAALLLMVLAPVAETAQARISAGGNAGTSTSTSNTINASSQNTGSTTGNRIPAGGSSTQTGNTINASTNAGNRIAASEAYHDIWTNHINASGNTGTTSTSNRIPAGGQSSQTGSHINAGGGTYPSTGSNRIPAGSGNTGGGVYPNSTGNRIDANNSGTIGYGCSRIPGGYCYQPGSRVDASGNTGSTSTGSTGGSRINAGSTGTTGTANTGNRIDANSSGFIGYGCSRIPGGYCYQPGNRVDASGNNNSTDGNRIDASGTSTPSTGNRIDASDNNSNGGNRIDASENNNNNNTCNNLPYPEDIDGHWSEIYVRRLHDLCIVEGYADGKFRPDQPITRAEMLKMGLLGGGIAPNPGCYDNDCGSPFNDLDQWQGPWVRSAYDRGIVQGYSADRFAPNQNITRAEAVKVVLSTYNIAPLNVTESFFKDVNGWELGWVEKARVIGLVQGIGNGNFDPNRPITRAEAAKIIVKMIEYYDTKI